MCTINSYKLILKYDNQNEYTKRSLQQLTQLLHFVINDEIDYEGSLCKQSSTDQYLVEFFKVNFSKISKYLQNTNEIMFDPNFAPCFFDLMICILYSTSLNNVVCSGLGTKAFRAMNEFYENYTIKYFHVKYILGIIKKKTFLFKKSFIKATNNAMENITDPMRRFSSMINYIVSKDLIIYLDLVLEGNFKLFKTFNTLNNRQKKLMCLLNNDRFYSNLAGFNSQQNSRELTILYYKAYDYYLKMLRYSIDNEEGHVFLGECFESIDVFILIKFILKN